MGKHKRILVDSWYADYLQGDVTAANQALENNYSTAITKFARRSHLLRGILLYKLCQKFDVIVATLGGKGITVFIILQALFSPGKNRLILLEFFRPTPVKKLYKLIWPLWIRFILGPGLRKSLANAQVLTESEVQSYSRIFGLTQDHFKFIAWPLHFDQKRKAEPGKNNIEAGPELNDLRNYVMASGRANVDWDMLFEAAEHSDWMLLAVCNAGNLDRVNALNRNKKAIVLHDISQVLHGELVKASTVYALAVTETNTSVGHIRLMNTIEHGVAVVATNVSGLRGYAVDGVNALLVPPGDADALKKAIDSLMVDSELREHLIKNARNFQQSRTFTNYISEVDNWIAQTVSNVR